MPLGFSASNPHFYIVANGRLWRFDKKRGVKLSRRDYYQLSMHLMDKDPKTYSALMDAKTFWYDNGGYGDLSLQDYLGKMFDGSPDAFWRKDAEKYLRKVIREKKKQCQT